MNSKKEQIVLQIERLAASQNFMWLNEYSKPKDRLIFRCNKTGVLTETNWSNLKQRAIIPVRNNNSYHQQRLELLCKSYDLTLLNEYKAYTEKVKYKCNICGSKYERCIAKINKCKKCNNFYSTNKGINKTTVLRTPLQSYNLYFVHLPKYNAYKIGLYKSKYIKSRFNTPVQILNVVSLPLYKAYYLEQIIIRMNLNNMYTGEKFGGYTEAFNTSVDQNNIMKIMAASIPDVEPRELLENLEADNQQPSFVEIH